MASRAPFPSPVITKRTRGYLPHWERNNGTYFVTFRLGDSLPEAVLEELARHKRILAAAKASGRILRPLDKRRAGVYKGGSMHFGQPQEGGVVRMAMDICETQIGPAALESRATSY